MNGQNGALTSIAGSPFAAGNRPLAVAVDPWDEFVYVANTGSSDISAYAINANGSLTPLRGSPFAARPFTAAIAVDNSAQYVYVPAQGGVLAYTISNSGSLSWCPALRFLQETAPYR